MAIPLTSSISYFTLDNEILTTKNAIERFLSFLREIACVGFKCKSDGQGLKVTPPLTCCVHWASCSFSVPQFLHL